MTKNILPENYNDPMDLGTRPKSDKTKHYVDNDKFLQVILDYRKACRLAKKEHRLSPPIPNYLGTCWTQIGWGLLKYPRFYRYPHVVKEEMVQDAVENCVRYFDNFDPKIKDNPFGYFSLLILRSFYRSISKEKKLLYVKYKESIRRGTDSLLEEVEKELGGSGDNPELNSAKAYDNIGVFVEKFEESCRKKKAKAIAKKAEKAAAVKEEEPKKKKKTKP